MDNIWLQNCFCRRSERYNLEKDARFQISKLNQISQWNMYQKYKVIILSPRWQNFWISDLILMSQGHCCGISVTCFHGGNHVSLYRLALKVPEDGQVIWFSSNEFHSRVVLRKNKLLNTSLVPLGVCKHLECLFWWLSMIFLDSQPSNLVILWFVFYFHIDNYVSMVRVSTSFCHSHCLT